MSDKYVVECIIRDKYKGIGQFRNMISYIPWKNMDWNFFKVNMSFIAHSLKRIRQIHSLSTQSWSVRPPGLWPSVLKCMHMHIEWQEFESACHILIKMHNDVSQISWMDE